MKNRIWVPALVAAALWMPLSATDFCRAYWPSTAWSGGRYGTPENVWNSSAEGYLLRAALMYADGNYTGASDQLHVALWLCEADFGVVPGAVDAGEDALLLQGLALQGKSSDKCVKALEKFLRKYPASRYRVIACAALGNYYFFNGNWGSACVWYERADLKSFGGSALDTYRYRYALSLLKSGLHDKARTLFGELSAGTPYAASARFYLAFIDYAEGRYAQAVSGFASSGIAAGWYNAQIAFEQEKYREAAEAAISLWKEMGSASGNMGGASCPIGSADAPLYRAEMARVAGESLFKLGEYEKARPWLERYCSYPAYAAPSALFDLGVIAYHDGEYEKAESLFSQVTSRDNGILCENAWLYMGQCLARQGDNTAAAMAFENAWRNVRNPNVGETAMYDYIVAVAKGGNVPFASATGVMEQFLNTYPRSGYAAEVRKYLGTAYYMEKDYAKALEALDNIPNPDKATLQAMQLVLYELGCMEQSNGLHKEASTHLKRAVELKKYNSEVAAESSLWLGQAYYDLGKWKESQGATQAYIDAGGSRGDRGLALYDLAYAYYQEDDFRKAARFFEEAYGSPTLPKALAGDALLRTADCLYYCGDYSRAYQLYERAEKVGGVDNAYASLRAAMMHGLQGDMQRKASDIEAMIARYPDSKWTAQALLELASAYAVLGNISKAVAAYNRVTSEWPSSAEAPQAMLQLALLYSNHKDTDKAIEAYKELIQRWPDSDASRAGNTDLRRLMGEKGALSEYVAFINSVPGAPKISESEVESIAFETAENRWTEDWKQTSALEKYVADYPDGAYLAPALYDLAFSYSEAGKYSRALEMLNNLLSKRPSASQVTDALLLKAEILEEHFPDRTAETLAVYREIEKRGGAALTSDLYAGLMRLTDDASERLGYAQKVLDAGSLSNEQNQEATFYKATALISLGRTSDGVAELTALASNPATLYGARAAVALGQYYIDTKQYTAAQKELLDFTDHGTSHYYWLARGYIALADAYAGEGRLATAREYINALNANYPGKEKDIKEMITTRLNKWK